jgi:hypothetical protein
VPTHANALHAIPFDADIVEELQLRLAVERAYHAARLQVFDMEASGPGCSRTPDQVAVVVALEAAESRLHAFRLNRLGKAVPAPRESSEQA